jgi:hypothetical protein
MKMGMEGKGCFNCKHGEDTKDGKVKCTVDNNKVHDYNYMCSLWKHILK